jgi:hypothetical protein
MLCGRLRRNREGRTDRDLEPERRLFRQPRRIPVRLLQRLQGHARLFLTATELRVGRTETTRFGAVDTVLLAVLAVAAVGMTIWVDTG